MMASIVSGPIVIDDILKKLNPGNTGAIVTFIGTVRDTDVVAIFPAVSGG